MWQFLLVQNDRNIGWVVRQMNLRLLETIIRSSHSYSSKRKKFGIVRGLFFTTKRNGLKRVYKEMVGRRFSERSFQAYIKLDEKTSIP